MKKLYRSRESTIGGVCQGISDYFGINSWAVQLISVILCFTPFPIITIYLLLWILIPKEPL